MIIYVLENGSTSGGRSILVPATIEQLLERISMKFSKQAKRLFHQNGHEITEIKFISNLDRIYFTCGEYFIQNDQTTPDQGTNLPKPILCAGEKASSSYTNKEKLIKFNVSGKKFVTTDLSILRKEPDSILNGILEKQNEFIQDEKGHFFFNRNPECFSILMAHLRGEIVETKNLTDLKKILLEAKFFKFNSLCEQIQNSIKEHEEGHFVEEKTNENKIETNINKLTNTMENSNESFERNELDSTKKFRIFGGSLTFLIKVFHHGQPFTIPTKFDKTLGISTFHSGFLEKVLESHSFLLTDIVFDPSGKYFLSSSFDRTIKLWDFEKTECIRIFTGHDDFVTSVVFLSNGENFFSCSHDLTIKLWNVSTGECKKTFEGHKDWINMIRLNEDETLLASCSVDKKIFIWKTKKNAFLEDYFILKGHQDDVTCITWAPRSILSLFACYNNGKIDEILVSGSKDHSIRMWDINSRTCIWILYGFGSNVIQINFLSNGEYFLSASKDGFLRVWDIELKAFVEEIKAHSNFLFIFDLHPNLQILASGHLDEEIDVFEISWKKFN